MKSSPLHSWNLTPTEAVALQRQLASQVSLEPFKLEAGMLIAGTDVSYRRFSSTFHAGVVVLEYPSLRIVEEAVATLDSPFPYVPGLLSFRELPAIIAACEKLLVTPDLIMVDGQGLAHPRRFGLACHLGIWFDLPTIGCAKSRLCGNYKLPNNKRGSITALSAGDEEIGRVVCNKDNVRPLFVSPGHRCDFDSAATVVLECYNGYRLPEPTRQAHLLANRQRLQTENN